MNKYLWIILAVCQSIAYAQDDYPCPQYSSPSPDWCNNGLIVPSEPSENGCYNPSTCLRLEDYYSNLEKAKLIGCEAGHITEDSHKEAYFSDGILSIPYVGLDFTPGNILEAQLQLAEDGRWDLLSTKSGLSGVKAVKFGHYFGMCGGYCQTEVIITATTITFKKSGWQQFLPEITIKSQNTKEDWTDLIGLIDYPTFAALPSVLGCPDCVDQGGYFIEIHYEERQKRIDLSINAGIEALFTKLNEILTSQELVLQTIND
ncbi:MAG: hypothetical protein QM487_00275 [Candidatus Marithrix sp.]